MLLRAHLSLQDSHSTKKSQCNFHQKHRAGWLNHVKPTIFKTTLHSKKQQKNNTSSMPRGSRKASPWHQQGALLNRMAQAQLQQELWNAVEGTPTQAGENTRKNVKYILLRKNVKYILLINKNKYVYIYIICYIVCT